VLQDDYEFQLGAIKCFSLVASGANQDGVIASMVGGAGTKDVKTDLSHPCWHLSRPWWVGVLFA